MAARIFCHLLGKEFINLRESFAVKISFPVPRGTRNTLGVEDDGKILLGAGKQAYYATPASAL
jgi:hypothetical protein